MRKSLIYLLTAMAAVGVAGTAYAQNAPRPEPRQMTRADVEQHTAEIEYPNG